MTQEEYEDYNEGFFESCPHCGKEYDHIDFDYQICSHCKRDATKEYCEWCEEEIKLDATTNEFLTGVFGYKYCSDDCMQNHINSK